MKGIKILKNNKAAGLDGMLCEQIKQSTCMAERYAEQHPCGKVIVILKPGKESSLHKIYRPISLLCYTFRLFERMILNHLKHITEHTIIREQAGFRAGKSSQLLNLTQYIEDGYQKSLTTGTVFMNYRLLLTKLYGMTEDAEFTKLIGSMMRNRRFYVELNWKKSRWRNQKNGLLQMSVLSPVLLNVYTNNQPVHNEASSFIYADDLYIATQRSTFEQTETILTEALQNLG